MLRGLAYKHEGWMHGGTVGASMRSKNPRAEASLRAKVLGEGTEVKTKIE